MPRHPVPTGGVRLPIQGSLLACAWDGARIAHVYEKSEPIARFDDD